MKSSVIISLLLVTDLASSEVLNNCEESVDDARRLLEKVSNLNFDFYDESLVNKPFVVMYLQPYQFVRYSKHDVLDFLCTLTELQTVEQLATLIDQSADEIRTTLASWNYYTWKMGGVDLERLMFRLVATLKKFGYPRLPLRVDYATLLDEMRAMEAEFGHNFLYTLLSDYTINAFNGVALEKVCKALIEAHSISQFAKFAGISKSDAKAFDNVLYLARVDEQKVEFLSLASDIYFDMMLMAVDLGLLDLLELSAWRRSYVRRADLLLRESPSILARHSVSSFEDEA